MPLLRPDLPSSSFLTYDNPEHHVRIEYPANWTAEEKNLELESQVMRIFPNGFLADRISPVGLEIYDTPRDGSDNLTLTQLSIDREGYTKTSPYTRFVNSTNTTISGLPAYSILYYDFPNPIFTTMNQTQKILHTMTLSDNGFFNIVYYSQPEYFDKYLPQAKRMLNSFQITDE